MSGFAHEGTNGYRAERFIMARTAQLFVSPTQRRYQQMMAWSDPAEQKKSSDAPCLPGWFRLAPSVHI